MAEQQQEELPSFDYLISDLQARIRILEGKNTLSNERILVMNQNMIKEYKKTIQEMKDLDQEIRALKQELFEVKNTMRHITTELNFFARKENLKVLEKYINMWSPLNFVTKEDVRNLIKEEGDKKDGK